MTGFEARSAFLEWLEERRAAPLTVEAYGADIAGFLGFLTQHLGGEPDLAALAALRQADLRAWLASEAADGRRQRDARAASVGGAQLLPLPGAAAWRGEPGADADRDAAWQAAGAAGAGACDQARDVTEQIGEMSDAAAIQARDTALFTLLYGCGLRIAEALALDVRDAPLPGADGDAARGRQGRQGAHRAGAAGGARGDRRLAGAASGSAAGQPAVPRRARRTAGPGGGAAHAAACSGG